MTSALVLIDLMPRIVALPVAPHSGEEVLDRVEFVADAMSGLAADEHDFTVEKIFPRFGDVRKTEAYT